MKRLVYLNLMFGISILSLACLSGSFASDLSPQSDFAMGVKVYQQGQYDLAVQYFRQALKKDEMNPNIHYYLADALVKTYHLSEAQLEFEKIIAMAPTSQAAKLSQTALTQLSGYRATRSSVAQWHLQGQVVPGSSLPKSGHQIVVKERNYLDNITDNGRFVRWSLEKLPLKVYIDSHPTGIRNFEPGFVSKVQQAIAMWARATTPQLTYQWVSDKAQADIQVTWVNSIDSKGHDTEVGTAYTAGLTAPQIRQGQLVAMEIQLATFDITQRPQSADKIYQVALHEMGHALGLVGHSPYPQDIMYPQTQHNGQLSDSDRTTISTLYGQIQPDITNLPPSSSSSTPTLIVSHQGEDRVAEVKQAIQTDLKKLKNPDPLLGQTLTALSQNQVADSYNQLRLLQDIVSTQVQLAAQKGSALPWLNLSNAYFKMGKARQSAGQQAVWMAKALESANQAIGMESKQSQGYYTRSVLYQALHQYSKAEPDIRRALKYDGQNPKYYLNLAWILANLNRKAEAQDALHGYLQRSPGAASSTDVQRIQTRLMQL